MTFARNVHLFSVFQRLGWKYQCAIFKKKHYVGTSNKNKIRRCMHEEYKHKVTGSQAYHVRCPPWDLQAEADAAGVVVEVMVRVTV